MFIVESDNFSAFQRLKFGVLRLGSVIIEALFASLAVIYSCALASLCSQWPVRNSNTVRKLMRFSSRKTCYPIIKVLLNPFAE